MKDLGLDKIVEGIKIDGVSPYVEAEKESWADIPFWIPTSCIGFDYAVSGFKRGFKGGIPGSRAVEINGFESTAKSSWLILIIKAFLGMGGAVFLADREHASDATRMQQFGCDLTNFRYIEKPKLLQKFEDETKAEEGEDDENEAQTQSKKGKKSKKKKIASDIVLEEFFDISEETIRRFRQKVNSEVPILLALDSLAAIQTMTQSQVDNMNMKEKLDKAGVMEQRFNKFCSLMTNLNGTVILVNQLRTKPGEIYGDPLYSPGGDAKNYAFSLRIRMERAKKIKIGDPDAHLSNQYVDSSREYLNGDAVGIQCRGQLVKNKVAEPFRNFRFPFLFNSGIPEEWAFAQLIIDREKWRFNDDFERNGNTYVWRGNKLGIGEKGLTEAFLDDPSLMIELEEALFM